MTTRPHNQHSTHTVASFDDLISIPYEGEVNALCWSRKLAGDFSEIVNAVDLKEHMLTLDEPSLLELDLSEAGNLARETLLQDLKRLQNHGASPTLNVIKHYDRDDAFPYFPVDVYSYHVDQSPVATDTFLCTYYGEPSEILSNAQAKQKVLVPEIRTELKKLYDGPAAGFEAFLTEYFFDLHYQAQPGAEPIGLGIGHMWRLAVDHPGSAVLPCIHRAPVEKPGEHRLLMIC